MANVIGPTFNDELRAAGVSDFRLAWSRDTGVIDYHPDYPDDERKKVEAVLAAHDGPLSAARQQALEATNAEIAKRRAELFLQPPSSLEAAFAEITVLDRGFRILKKAGAALPEERLDLDAIDDLLGRKEAILEVGQAAKAALLGAKSVEEVQAVKVGWPGD
jgi:hypothetical protein